MANDALLSGLCPRVLPDIVSFHVIRSYLVPIVASMRRGTDDYLELQAAFRTFHETISESRFILGAESHSAGFLRPDCRCWSKDICSTKTIPAGTETIVFRRSTYII